MYKSSCVSENKSVLNCSFFISYSQKKQLHETIINCHQSSVGMWDWTSPILPCVFGVCVRLPWPPKRIRLQNWSLTCKCTFSFVVFLEYFRRENEGRRYLILCKCVCSVLTLWPATAAGGRQCPFAEWKVAKNKLWMQVSCCLSTLFSVRWKKFQYSVHFSVQQRGQRG
jgi:hypothetical protein